MKPKSTQQLEREIRQLKRDNILLKKENDLFLHGLKVLKTLNKDLEKEKQERQEEKMEI